MLKMLLLWQLCNPTKRAAATRVLLSVAMLLCSVATTAERVVKAIDIDSATVDGCQAVQSCVESGAVRCLLNATTTSQDQTAVRVVFIDCRLQEAAKNIDVEIAVGGSSSLSTRYDEALSGDHSTNTSSSSSTYVIVRNTTMTLRSFTVVPYNDTVPTTQATPPSPPPPPPLSNKTTKTAKKAIQDLHIVVDGKSVVNAEGDVLVVLDAVAAGIDGDGDDQTTRSPSANLIRRRGVRNVNIAIHDATIISDKGNVASVILGGAATQQLSRTPSHTLPTDAAAAAEGVSITIGESTILQTKHGSMMASIFANVVLQSSLLASSCCCSSQLETNNNTNSCGPISLIGGNKGQMKDMGILSIFSPPPPPTTTASGTLLHVEDTRIVISDTCGGAQNSTFSETGDLMVASDGSNIASPPPPPPPVLSITATIHSGLACVGSICLSDGSTATLQMTGTNAIEIRLARTLPHQLVAKSSSNSHGGAAVGGVVVISDTRSSDSNVVVNLFNNCTFTMSIEIGSKNDDGSSPPHHSLRCAEKNTNPADSNNEKVPILLSATSNPSNGGASAVVGMALNTYCYRKATPVSKLIISNGSALNIISSLYDNTNNTQCSKAVDKRMQSTANFQRKVVSLISSVPSRAACAVLGISVNSKSEASLETNSNLLVTNHSRIVIMSKATNSNSTSNGEEGANENVVSPQHDVYSLQALGGLNRNAVSLLGVAVNCFSDKGIPTTDATIAEAGSQVAIFAHHNASHTVTEMMSTSGYLGATTILGLAMLAHQHSSARGFARLYLNGTSLSIPSTAPPSYPILDIQALFLSNVLLDVKSVGDTRTPIAILGVAVVGGQGSLLSFKEYFSSTKEGGPSPGSPTAINIWVGVVNTTEIETPKDSPAIVIVGIVSRVPSSRGSEFLNGLESSNTAIGFCSNGPFFNSATSATAVILETKPTTAPPIVVNESTSWNPHHQQQYPHDKDQWCSQASMALQTAIEDEVQNARWRSLPTGGASPPLPSAIPTTTITLTQSSSFLLPATTKTPTSAIDDQMKSTTTASSTHLISLEKTHTLSRLDKITTRSVSLEGSEDDPVVPPPTASWSPLPTSKKRSVSIATSVLLPGNQEAATTVLATAGASSAVASTLGSSGGGAMVVAGSSVRMMECGLADDDPRPASFELPIQFALADGSMRYFAGAALAHTLVQCFLFALAVFARRIVRQQKSSTKQIVSMAFCGGRVVTYMSMAFCGAHAFFTPAILGACSTVLFNSGTHDSSYDSAVAGGCALLVVVIHTLVVVAVHRGPRNGIVARASRVLGLASQKTKLVFRVKASASQATNRSGSSTTTTTTSSGTSSSSSDTDSSEDGDDSEISAPQASTHTVGDSALLFSGISTKDILLTLFDGCRIYEKATHRHYASIETTLYSVIAIISGARPKDNCNYAAFAIGALATLHLLYILTIRPFRTKLDTIFSVINAVLLVVLSLTVAVSLHTKPNDVTSSSGVSGDDGVVATHARLLETCLWLISVVGFLQLAVQGVWAYHVAQRRIRHELQEEEQQAIDDNQTQQSQAVLSSYSPEQSSSESSEDADDVEMMTPPTAKDDMHMRRRGVAAAPIVAATNPLDRGHHHHHGSGRNDDPLLVVVSKEEEERSTM